MSFQAEYIAELTSLLRDPELARLRVGLDALTYSPALLRDPELARLRVGLDALTYSPAPSELLPEILTLALFHPTPEIRQQAGQVLQTSISGELHHTIVHAASPSATARAEAGQEDDVHRLLTSLLACAQIDSMRLYETSLPYIPEAWDKISLSTLLESSQPLFVRRCRDLVRHRHALDLSHCRFRGLPGQVTAIPGLQSVHLNDNPDLDIRQVLQQAAQIPTLRELSLRQTGLSVLPPEIQGLSELVALDLSYNALCDLPGELHRLRRLRRIQLYSNPLYNFAYFERFFENTHHLPYANYRLFQAMYHDLNFSIVHIRSYKIVCLFIEHFGIQRLIYRLLQVKNFERVKKLSGQKFLLKIVADDMLSLKDGKGELSQSEFEELAVHLHILYLDEAAQCLVAEVGEQRSGEVVAALLEGRNRVFFTCHYV